MDKKQIQKLVEMSFVDNILNQESLNKVIEQLDGSELKEFLRLLTDYEKKSTVYIDHSFELTESNKKQFEDLFLKRKIVYRKNESLVFGIRITDNDMVYDLNMKNSLEQIKDFLRSN
jgi:F0F1-type ATP synthase delta subunit